MMKPNKWHAFRLLLSCTTLSAVLSVSAQATENPVSLSLPIDCEPGVSCWIPNYVDLKPGPGVLDYTCGDASYDADPGGMHKGTDFAVRDLAAVRKGVDVLAAAAGIVLGLRDGVADTFYAEGSRASVQNVECGNGVRIQHHGGVTTQYCHLRNGSVRVKRGDQVSRGQVLGLVGISGMTTFPHLHFQVEQGQSVLDPFVGLVRTKACGVGEQPLWDAPALAKLTYQPSTIFNAGFSPEKPNQTSIRSGLYADTVFKPTEPAMVLWAEVFRVRAADQIVITITGPKGEKVHKQRLMIEADKAYYYAFSGVRLKPPSWPRGSYTGEVTLNRQGTKSISVSRTLRVQ